MSMTSSASELWTTRCGSGGVRGRTVDLLLADLFRARITAVPSSNYPHPHPPHPSDPHPQILLSSTIGRNKGLIPGEVLSALISGTEEARALAPR